MPYWILVALVNGALTQTPYTDQATCLTNKVTKTSLGIVAQCFPSSTPQAGFAAMPNGVIVKRSRELPAE